MFTSKVPLNEGRPSRREDGPPVLYEFRLKDSANGTRSSSTRSECKEVTKSNNIRRDGVVEIVTLFGI